LDKVVLMINQEVIVQIITISWKRSMCASGIYNIVHVNRCPQ